MTRLAHLLAELLALTLFTACLLFWAGWYADIIQ